MCYPWINSKLIDGFKSAIFVTTVALYTNLRLIKIRKTRTTVILFIDLCGWCELFLHVLSNIKYFVLFRWPPPACTSSNHNTHFIIAILNLLYLCRKDFVIAYYNNPPVTSILSLINSNLYNKSVITV